MLTIAIAVVFFLVVLNGLFAMSEMALVSARKSRLQMLADRGSGNAKAAIRLSEDPTRFLSSVQVGITLIGILAGAYGQATIASELRPAFAGLPVIGVYSEALSTGLVVVVLTYLSVIVGELVPKRLALIHPESIALAVARPIDLFSRALHPFVYLLTLSTAAALAILRVKDDDGTSITHEEVESVLAEGAGAGVIEPQEREMMQGVMRLGDRSVRVAMTPRTEIYWVSLSDSDEEVRRDIRDCPHTRFVLVQEGNLDDPIGVVHKRDVADQLLAGGPLDLAEAAYEPLLLPETASVLHALERFKGSPIRMAFVVDEYGSLQGVVTPIDILEMIAGDLAEGPGPQVPSIVRRADGSFLVDGKADLEDLAAELGEPLDAGPEYHTAAGLVLSALGHLPTEGEIVDIGRFRIEVIDMDGRRIDKLLVSEKR